MGTLEALTGRDYLSYSSLTSWLDCGERFRLERVLNAPQSRAWWFIAGSAIHTATERCDLEGSDNWKQHWSDAWQEQLQLLSDEGVRLDEIKAGGRKTTAYPNKEDQRFWANEGPAMVQGWVIWRNRMIEHGWSFLEIDGKPAIEVPIELKFETVTIKGYIDRGMVDRHGQVHVVDLKSGSREPASTLQLGIYALGLEDNYGVGVPLGAYFMTRKGDLANVSSLRHYTKDRIEQWFSSAKRGIESEVFIPKVGPFCPSCSVSPYCAAVGGNPDSLEQVLAKDDSIKQHGTHTTGGNQ